MQDLFSHAVRSSQSRSGNRKLNFRQAERRVPKEFSGEVRVREVCLPDGSSHEQPGTIGERRRGLRSGSVASHGH